MSCKLSFHLNASKSGGISHFLIFIFWNKNFNCCPLSNIFAEGGKYIIKMFQTFCFCISWWSEHRSHLLLYSRNLKAGSQVQVYRLAAMRIIFLIQHLHFWEIQKKTSISWFPFTATEKKSVQSWKEFVTSTPALSWKNLALKHYFFRQLRWRTQQEWIFINYGACSVRPAGMME